MGIQTFSGIAAAGSTPALTDQVVGVTGGTTDKLFSLAQVAAAIEFVIPTSDTGGGSILAGANAGKFMTSSAAWSNVAIGLNTLSSSSMTTSAVNNLAIGASALSSVTSGSQNLCIGVNAGKLLTTATNLVAFGYNALSSSTTSGNNVAIGAYALASVVSGSSGSTHVAIGYQSLQFSTTGFNNIGIGAQTLQALNNGNSTYSGSNVAIGSLAGSALTYGSNNIFIGNSAGVSVTNNSYNNTLLGAWAGAASISNVIGLSDGGGNLQGDYAYTHSGWTLQTGLNLAYAGGSAGLLVVDASNNVTSNTSVTTVTTPANFSANRKIAVNIGGTTYYIPADTAAW